MKTLGFLFLTSVMVLMILIGVWSREGKKISSLAELLPTVTPTLAGMVLDSAPAQAREALPPPTAQPSDLPAATVNDSANLRSGPGTIFQVVGSAAAGESVQIVARNATGDWYQLENGYWIAAFLVSNAPQELSIVEVAALE